MIADDHADRLAQHLAAEIVDRHLRAVTEPWPVGVDAGPFISVRTPILTTSSETWARAAGEANIMAANTPSRDIFLASISSPSVTSGELAIWLDRELKPSGRFMF